MASGAYSYLLLCFVVRFSYNVFFHWFAELALIPAALLAFVIFRSLLRGLRDFILGFYRTKTGEGAFRFTPLRAFLGIGLLAILFVPIVRDRENAYFVIEPSETHQVHARVPGRVMAVYVKEGDAVHIGQVLARLQSLNATAAGEEAAAQVASSQARVLTAELQHSGLGDALAAQQAARRNSDTAREEGAQLAVTAPSAGVVATNDPESLLNRDVTTGEPLLTIADPSHLVARLYVPVSELDHVREGDPVSLQLSSQFAKIRGRLPAMEGSALPLPPGLMAAQEYKGIAVPTFYTARMSIKEAGSAIQPGMSGPAKIFGRRRSLAARIVTIFGNLLRTHFW
jgi:multidrug efflux pump subunit AcrA (membrane-fusion protein)